MITKLNQYEKNVYLFEVCKVDALWPKTDTLIAREIWKMSVDYCSLVEQNYIKCIGLIMLQRGKI